MYARHGLKAPCYDNGMVTYHTHIQISVYHDADFVCHFDSVGELVGIYQVKNKTCCGDLGEYALGAAAYGFGLLFTDYF